MFDSQILIPAVGLGVIFKIRDIFTVDYKYRLHGFYLKGELLKFPF